MPAAYTLDNFMEIVESENFKEQYGEVIDVSTIVPDNYKLPNEDYYILPVIETQLGLYLTKSVDRLPDSVVKENLLLYPFRVYGTLAKPSDVYNSYPEMLKQLAKTCNLAIDNMPDYNNLIKSYAEMFEEKE